MSSCIIIPLFSSIINRKAFYDKTVTRVCSNRLPSTCLCPHFHTGLWCQKTNPLLWESNSCSSECSVSAKNFSYVFNTIAAKMLSISKLYYLSNKTTHIWFKNILCLSFVLITTHEDLSVMRNQFNLLAFNTWSTAWESSVDVKHMQSFIVHSLWKNNLDLIPRYSAYLLVRMLLYGFQG